METSGGKKILLDCAASAVHRMAQEKLDWAQLDAIWISHFHLDHVGGLPVLLYGTKHAPEIQERTKKLKIFGAEGLETLLKNFDAVNGYKLFKQPFPIEVIEVEPFEEFEIFGVKAVTLKTLHTAESLAIHLRDADDKTLVYTADTGYEKTLGDFARFADLLILECAFFRDKSVETHLELKEAMHLARYAAPKKIVLTHLYPEWDEINLTKEAEKFSPPCEVIEARDGLRIEI